MIRSTYEYNHSEWIARVGNYNFCGVPIIDMQAEELRAALAFMVQYAGDLTSKLHEEQFR